MDDKILRMKNEKSPRQWEVAENMGISEFTLSRYLRRPEKLSAELRHKIETAIEKTVNREG